MTDQKKSQETSGGCCSGPDFKFPMGKSEEMSRMMEKFCGEDGSIDCGEMMNSMQKKFGSSSEKKDSE